MKIIISIAICMTSLLSYSQSKSLVNRTFVSNLVYMCVETDTPRDDTGVIINMALTFMKDKVEVRLYGYEHGVKVDSLLPSLVYHWEKGKIKIPGLKFDGKQIIEKDELIYKDNSLIGTRTGDFDSTIIFEESIETD